ncbi:hypothetical protein ACWDTI_16660 [Gordonia sp. NPDC003424]
MPGDDGPLDEIADALYALTPAEFVAARTEFAKAARTDGDRELAQRVGKLRRPTQVAWAINAWSRTHPDDVDDLAELARELTDAQRRSAADRLRTLSARRQDLIATATRAVSAAAADQGARLSENALRETGQTLRAALADEAVLADLRRGRLVTAAEYSGFGPSGLFLVPEAAAPSPPPDAAPPPADGSDVDAAERQRIRAQMLAEAEARLADAQTAETHARDAEQHHAGGLADLGRQVTDLEARIETLTAELARGEDELRFLHRQVTAAEAEHATAREALTSAQERTAREREVVDELRRQAPPAVE